MWNTGFGDLILTMGLNSVWMLSNTRYRVQRAVIFCQIFCSIFWFCVKDTFSKSGKDIEIIWMSHALLYVDRLLHVFLNVALWTKPLYYRYCSIIIPSKIREHLCSRTRYIFSSLTVYFSTGTTLWFLHYTRVISLLAWCQNHTKKSINTKGNISHPY
jgi:hypothetical protein